MKLTRRNFLAASGVLVGLAGLAGCTTATTTTSDTGPDEGTDESQGDGGGEAQAGGTDTITGTYAYHVAGGDWGCGVDKVVLTLNDSLDAVAAVDFTVTETKQTTDWTDPAFAVIETTVARTITDAYLCDDDGNKTDEPSASVMLELYISPDDGSPMLYTLTTGYNTWSDPYYLTITASDEAALTSGGVAVTSFTIDTEATVKTTDADLFETDTFTASDGVTYGYAAFAPEGGSDTLFVWLHGMGEGGAALSDLTDPYVTCLANKVTALAGDDFQTTLGGAYVLVPQCPTYWMDTDGNSGNYNDGSIEGTRDSFYTASLTEFIDSYAQEIGVSKIVVGGCSNGGYMTMLMAITNGDKYQAYVPICEALPNSEVTDDDIAILKDLNLYFVYSEDDPVVDPTAHEIPTIERLRDAGAVNLHVSTTESVVDTSGEYYDSEGDPYTYNGHWSWIYFDNDDTSCNDCAISAFDWIAETIG